MVHWTWFCLILWLETSGIGEDQTWICWRKTGLHYWIFKRMILLDHMMSLPLLFIYFWKRHKIVKKLMRRSRSQRKVDLIFLLNGLTSTTCFRISILLWKKMPRRKRILRKSQRKNGSLSLWRSLGISDEKTRRQICLSNMEHPESLWKSSQGLTMWKWTKLKEKQSTAIDLFNNLPSSKKNKASNENLLKEIEESHTQINKLANDNSN